MPFQDGMSIPEEMLFKMKSLKNMTKNTIHVLPSSGQTTYGAGQTISFVLPYASLMSLSDISLQFEGHTTNYPAFMDDAGIQYPALGVKFPRYMSSLIEMLEISINGQIVQQINRYNDVYNLLYNHKAQGTSHTLLENDNPKLKHYIDVANNQQTQVTDLEYSDAPMALTDAGKYIINNFLGLLGRADEQEVSSNFIDSNLYGEIIIRIRLAQNNVLMYSQPFPGLDAGTIDASIALAQPTYTLGNVKLSVQRYNMPSEFYSAISHHLSGGSKYKIAFNHYQIYSSPGNASGSAVRFNENSRDIKYLLGFFHDNNRDAINKPRIPLYGDLAYFYTNPYFRFSGDFHSKSQFQIGSTLLPQNAMDAHECYLDLTRLMGEKGSTHSMTTGIDTMAIFQTFYFCAPLSLEYAENQDGVKLLSGLSSENLPISISWNYKNRDGYVGFNHTANVLVCTNRILEVGTGQQVSVQI